MKKWGSKKKDNFEITIAVNIWNSLMKIFFLTLREVCLYLYKTNQNMKFKVKSIYYYTTNFLILTLMF